MVVGLVLVLVALGLIVPLVTLPLSTPHHQVGVTVVALVIFNPLLGMVRPHPPPPGEVKSRKRLAFEIVHKTCGRGAWALGVANIFLGWYYYGSELVPPEPSSAYVMQVFTIVGGVAALLFAAYAVGKLLVAGLGWGLPSKDASKAAVNVPVAKAGGEEHAEMF